jgi:hypothetical protein
MSTLPRSFETDKVFSIPCFGANRWPSRLGQPGILIGSATHALLLD